MNKDNGNRNYCEELSGEISGFQYVNMIYAILRYKYAYSAINLLQKC